ncbi:putative odorant receptor 69a [Cardiocondyla obscurior]|uniref:putative odorant receptor 69a n=1 Tax=Cardiocondyla obscurior TaxID=286306 RepID=UPI0039658263
MEYPEERYYKLNQLLLSISGLSPYQSKPSAFLIRFSFTIVMLSSLFVQISSMCTSDITLDYMVDGMQEFIIVLGPMVNIYTRSSYVDKFGELFERMSKNWALQKTQYEYEILHQYAKISRLLTLSFIIISYTVIVSYTVWMFTPEMLDIVLPRNESRPRKQPFKNNNYYFVDEDEYLYSIRFHACLVMFMLPPIYVTCCSLFVTFTLHICGMCELLGYRAERLFCVIEDKTVFNLTQRSQITLKNIAGFVQQHHNIIQFVDIVGTSHTISFLTDLIGIVILMSLTLIQLLTISSFEKALRSISVAVIALSYVFISCFMGQQITDLSSNISEKLFNSTWYNAVISQQKALLIIMMRRYHPLVLTACRLYVMSLQNYGMVKIKYAVLGTRES